MYWMDIAECSYKNGYTQGQFDMLEEINQVCVDYVKSMNEIDFNALRGIYAIQEYYMKRKAELEKECTN